MTSPHPAATRPPLHDIAHLGYIELLTPRLCESLWFFVEVLGMTETCREGNSVYLRTWDDYEHHTVKLTAHETSGIRRVGLRASSQAALEARVAAIEAAGLGVGWQDWRTITWTEAERAKGQAWGLKTIESFHTHGTPPVG